MSERTRAALALWRLDTEVQRAETLVTSLTAQLGDQVKVKAADLAIRRANEAVARARGAQKDAEFTLAQLEARIKEHDALLWSGKGSPRDLEALRLELERERTRRVALEEAALAAMEVTARAERDDDAHRLCGVSLRPAHLAEKDGGHADNNYNKFKNKVVYWR